MVASHTLPPVWTNATSLSPWLSGFHAAGSPSVRGAGVWNPAAVFAAAVCAGRRAALAYASISAGSPLVEGQVYFRDRGSGTDEGSKA